MTRTETPYGLSKRAYIGTLYYENSKVSARSSISSRGPRIDRSAANGNLFQGHEPTINIDASVRYKIADVFEVSLEGTKLTDADRDRDIDLDAQRNNENNHVGERGTDTHRYDRAVYGILRPRRIVFRAAVYNGAAILVALGGGNSWVVIDKEGFEIGRRPAARGWTAFLFFYRLPGEGGHGLGLRARRLGSQPRAS